jgi:predicted ester cyclase
MGSTNNKAIVERIFNELWHGASRMETLEELIAPDHVFHFHSSLNAVPEVGHQGYRQVLEGFASVFPDNRATIEPVIVDEGDFIVNRWLFVGTQLGPLGNIPPTGKRVSVSGLDITRISGGKAAETWVYADNLGMLMQLGVVNLPE